MVQRFHKKIDVRTGKEVLFNPLVRLNYKPVPCILVNGVIRVFPKEDVKYLVEPNTYNEKVSRLLYGKN